MIIMHDVRVRMKLLHTALQENLTERLKGNEWEEVQKGQIHDLTVTKSEMITGCHNYPWTPFGTPFAETQDSVGMFWSYSASSTASLMG
jgi:hypothetical protein